MDGRPHPPEWAADTWQGFSTGEWVGDMLGGFCDALLGPAVNFPGSQLSVAKLRRGICGCVNSRAPLRPAYPTPAGKKHADDQ